MSDGDSISSPLTRERALEGEAPISTVKVQARELREQALLAVETGDYRQARAFDARLVALGLDNEIGAEAAQERESLGPDPVAVLVGLAGLSLVIAAWVVSVW